MAEEKKKRFKKLRYKYRLVLMNDENFEQRLSFRLSRLNVFTFLVAISLFWIGIALYAIAFTSLREYIPGYTDTSIKPEIYRLNQSLDSLESVLYQNNLYINNIKLILSGGDMQEEGAVKSTTTTNYDDIKNHKSKADSLLRVELENQDKYNIYYHETKDIYDVTFLKNTHVLFTPVNGIITNRFNMSKSHLGIDIVAKRNDAIKAIDDGVVLLSEWTVNTGHIIAIQHANNMISVYKHNSSLLKKEGEYVNAGDLIAIIGNSGELSSGPHLHFELWINGAAVDPLKYISF